MLTHRLLIFSALATITAFFGQYGYWLDLSSHFRLQYFFIQLLCALFYLLRKKLRWTFVALAFALVNLSQIVPLYIPVERPVGQTSRTLTVATVNVNHKNVQYQKVIDYIDRVKPDIVGLEEVTPQWIDVLNGALEAYPYRMVQYNKHDFSVALYSKLPPKDMKVVFYGPVEVPSIVADFTLGDKPFTLFLVHIPSPVSPGFEIYRNEFITDMIRHRGDLGKTLIVAGDLNTGSWSYYFKQIITQMGLVDSRQGYGLETTWPFLFPWVGITIDHILVSPDIKVLDRKVGAYTGSDHFPVWIKLSI